MTANAPDTSSTWPSQGTRQDAVFATTANLDSYCLIRFDGAGRNARVVAEFESKLNPKFDAASSRLATFSAGELLIRDSRDGRVLHRVAVNEEEGPSLDPSHVDELCWFAGGEAIVIGSDSKCARCDLTTGHWTPLGVGTVELLAVEDGPRILKRDGRNVSVCDGMTGSPVCEFQVAYGNACSLSPDGRRLVHVGNSQARIVDVETGDELGTISVETPLESVLFSENGGTLVLISRQGATDQGFVHSFFARDPADVAGAR